MRPLYRNLRQEKTPEAFATHIRSLGLDLGFDVEVEPAPKGALARPAQASGMVIGNRLAILPMEGWDGHPDGRPSELTARRWGRFGASGAKLIWGGEAVAVRPDGRANPNQLVMSTDTVEDIAALRQHLVDEHVAAFGTAAGLVVGLQLTHSGRYARPDNGPAAPRIAYRHPLLDRRLDITDDSCVLGDDDLDELVEDFAAAALLAQEAGFSFVDVKACHGYLGHELLSAVDRPGRYGGSYENRTRFLTSTIEAIHRTAPGLPVGVRLSIFDWAPFSGPSGAPGVSEVKPGEAYPYAFGGDGTGVGIDLTEPKRLLDDLAEGFAIDLLCTTAGSPYYSPHIQRPATFPPSDGYHPPEDPLLGVARQIAATAELAAHRDDVFIVGSGYSYLQEWFGPVAQHTVRTHKADAVGLGRMALSHPYLAADLLAGRQPDPKLLCRTLSDCTTAPRHGLVSGCFPLDPFYAERPERHDLAAVKKAIRDERMGR